MALTTAMMREMTETTAGNTFRVVTWTDANTTGPLYDYQTYPDRMTLFTDGTGGHVPNFAIEINGTFEMGPTFEESLKEISRSKFGVGYIENIDFDVWGAPIQDNYERGY